MSQFEWKDQNYDSWIDKVHKELKTSDLSEKELYIDFDVIYNPFKDYSQSISKHVIQKFPELAYAQNVVVDNVLSANEIILQLLKNDLRVVKLTIVKDVDWNLLFKNIYLDLITLVLDVSPSVFDSFLTYKKDQSSDKWDIYFNGTTSSEVGEVLDYSNLNLSHSELFYIIKHDLKITQSAKVNLVLDITENLLHIIPFFRAVRVYFEANYPDKELVLSGQSQISKTSTDENDELIRAGSQSMFSSMAGINHLYIRPISDKSNLNHHRLLLNIQNLIALESGVTSVKDSLKGSYIIENLTQQYLDIVSD